MNIAIEDTAQSHDDRCERHRPAGLSRRPLICTSHVRSRKALSINYLISDLVPHHPLEPHPVGKWLRGPERKTPRPSGYRERAVK